MQKIFNLKSSYTPSGDQPQAIEQLVKGIERGDRMQTLLGVTGSGKTFSMANVIERTQKPALVLAHNKTLAAQLAQEYKEFFPDAAVHYFVSYYDYYQPEAYLPTTDTYIEKDAQINQEIDRLRHASTQSLLTRSDVIIVASVSCIYGLGSPEEYRAMHCILTVGQRSGALDIARALVAIHYDRVSGDLKPGTFRSIGNVIDIMSMAEEVIYSIRISGGTINEIVRMNPVSLVIIDSPSEIFLFPAKHFLTEGEKKEKALIAIEKELQEQLLILEADGKLLEAERIKRRTRYDLSMIREVGYCSGIENYSRHLSGKLPGEPPETLLSYFPHTADGKPEFLTIIDESHVTIPQLRGMYAGDASRKGTLIEHGFRLPSARDNRPLQFDEFMERVGQIICTTATPAAYEREHSTQIAEQIIRPTGLVDPEITVMPVTPYSSLATHQELYTQVDAQEGDASIMTFADFPETYPGQIQHFLEDAIAEIKSGGRVLATTLTKKMAEDLSAYLHERGINSTYLHSDVETLDRIAILTKLRRGETDCLIGVNLLREGLDLPEVTLVAIFDADKQGFLRSEMSLIQTMGRAARNVLGRVTLYADRVTDAMRKALGESRRRRTIQLAYNTEHNITPRSVKKEIKDITELMRSERDNAVANELATDMAAFGGNTKKLITFKQSQMRDAIKELDFETAAVLRDQIEILKGQAPKKKVGRGKK